MRSVSVLSSHTITPKALDELLTRLTAVREQGGWRLEREGRVVHAAMGTEDMHITFSDEDLAEAATLLGAPVKSRVALIYVDAQDNFAARMAVAVSRAMSEQWPTVFDTHSGQMYLVRAPNDHGESSS